MGRPKQTEIRVVRASTVRHLTAHFEALGATVPRLLSGAGISAELLEVPGTLVPVDRVFRFLELTCGDLGTEHPGLQLGLSSSLPDFGAYGRRLLASPTVGAYIEAGIRLYCCLNSGERFWLSAGSEGELRINFKSSGNHPLGAHQSHLCTLIMTILTIRRAAGPGWCPREMGLAYRSREPLPQVEPLVGTTIICGTDHSYITVPSALLQKGFPDLAEQRVRAADTTITPLPIDMLDILANQIDTFTSAGGAPRIDQVAESLSISRRTLQREIAGRGRTFGEILRERRLRRACEWLDHSEKSVTEIAFELGYTDASNFTRAFRREIGISPSAFRRQALSA